MQLHTEKKRLNTGILVFGVFTAFLWLIKGIELLTGTSFSFLGIKPLEFSGLAGILFAPLLHADVAHLTANSAPLFLLGAALVYYYRSESFKLTALLWLITGLWVWLLARGNAVHIGASGLVYALAAFHFTSGVIRREPRLMAFSLLVIFLYGSMVWGFFPDFFPKPNISWESHLMGAIAGIVIAYFYRDKGPQARVYEWEEESGDDPDDSGLPWQATADPKTAVPEPKPDKTKDPEIRYDYKP